MDMVIGLINSYGYRPLTRQRPAYDLFPGIVGGKNDAMRKEGPRQWPQDDERDGNGRLLALHRRRLVLSSSLSPPSPFTSRSRRTNTAFQCPRALRTRGRRCKPLPSYRAPRQILASYGVGVAMKDSIFRPGQPPGRDFPRGRALPARRICLARSRGRSRPRATAGRSRRAWRLALRRSRARRPPSLAAVHSVERLTGEAAGLRCRRPPRAMISWAFASMSSGRSANRKPAPSSKFDQRLGALLEAGHRRLELARFCASSLAAISRAAGKIGQGVDRARRTVRVSASRACNGRSCSRAWRNRSARASGRSPADRTPRSSPRSRRIRGRPGSSRAARDNCAARPADSPSRDRRRRPARHGAWRAWRRPDPWISGICAMTGTSQPSAR